MRPLLALLCVGPSWQDELIARPLRVARSGGAVTVSVAGTLEDEEESAVLAAYSPAGADIASQAPTRVVFLNGRKNVTFVLANGRATYDFVLYRATDSRWPRFFPARDALARSNAVEFADPNEPRAFRVLPAHGGFWKIVWSSRSDDVAFCELSGGRGRVFASRTTSPAYERAELCGSPAETVGFFDPGAVHEVVFACDAGELVLYSCGRDERDLSDPRLFRCPSLSSIVVLGHLGTATPDDSLTFSSVAAAAAASLWQSGDDFEEAEEESVSTTSPPTQRRTERRRPALATARFVAGLEDVDLVLQLGGLSLAEGYESTWDDYLDVIEAFASQFPYAPLLGRREYGADAGGECGVPATRLFPLTTKARPWTSFAVGLVHVVGLCTAADLTTDSAQWTWLQDDLQNVDRQRTPWVLVAGNVVPSVLTQHLEPLLLRYAVDLCFWGDDDDDDAAGVTYERHCAAADGHCLDRPNDNLVYANPGAPIHFVFPGTFVQEERGRRRAEPKTALRVLRGLFGVGRVDARNATHLEVAFVDNGANNNSAAGTVLDFAVVVKEEGPYRPPLVDVRRDDDDRSDGAADNELPPVPPRSRPSPDVVVLLVAGPLLLWVGYDSAKRRYRRRFSESSMHSEDDDDDVHVYDDVSSELDFHRYDEEDHFSPSRSSRRSRTPPALA